MTKVLKAMTIRTENFKIISLVVVSVSIFVMNAKYVRMLIKSASFACCYFASLFHICSNSCKRWSAIFNLLLIATLNRTVFFTRPFGGFVLNTAGIASSWFFFCFSAINFITILRTKLSDTCARIENSKVLRANDTRCYFASGIC